MILINIYQVKMYPAFSPISYFLLLPPFLFYPIRKSSLFPRLPTISLSLSLAFSLYFS